VPLQFLSRSEISISKIPPRNNLTEARGVAVLEGPLSSN
jgi:hypothetical protein